MKGLMAQGDDRRGTRIFQQRCLFSGRWDGRMSSKGERWVEVPEGPSRMGRAKAQQDVGTSPDKISDTQLNGNFR